jgi:hypothetical protein
MAIRYWIDKDRKLIRAELTGSFTIEEMFNVIKDTLNDPGFEKGFNILSNHLKVKRFITTPQVKGLAGLLASFRHVLENAKWAVVTVNPASFGMMRMLAVYLEDVPMELRIFETEREALQWLRPEEDKPFS